MMNEMILPFSTQFKDGTPTYFIEKIWNGLILSPEYESHLQWLDEFGQKITALASIPNENLSPKIHTIRQDAHDRWHEGSLIHPVVFNRSKNQFQFAPILICKSVQEIEITCYHGIGGFYSVVIDDRIILNSEIEILAKNDGFTSSEDFLSWFELPFNGKIIHWTDLKY